jgi:glycerophosphoryl diester phosphodiesterase
MKKNILYIGHRGTRTDYDENTLEAFDVAYKSGAQLVELDVRFSKDEKLVILHDETIDRTTNGSGLLKEKNYSELLKYRTNKKKSIIPLMNDVFNKFDYPKRFMIDLKDLKVKFKLISLIINNNISNQVIFSGRDYNFLRNIKQEVPDCHVCYNITKGIGLSLRQLLNESSDYLWELESNIDMISLKSSLISKKFINQCHRYQIKALAWDFINYENPITKIKEIISIGIDGILFDDHRNITIIDSWLKD